MFRFMDWMEKFRKKAIVLISLSLAVCLTAVACSGGSQQASTTAETGGTATAGIQPEVVVDYIHTVLLADRTAYTKHVVNRLQTLEGKPKETGVVPAEATEAWQDTGGIPLPAQMFRLGSEIASENGVFTYNLISPWNINDNHAPKSEFEQTAMQQVIETGEPYKGYQEVGGQTYFSALYPDKAVAEACVTCHNTHPIHLERFPDKQFEMNEVMGGVIINLPVDQT